MSRRAFTAIELLVTVAVLAILAGVAVPTYEQMKKGVALSSSAADIVNALRTAQNKAIASQNHADHSVAFDAAGGTYTIYRRPASSPPVALITSSLPAGLSFTVSTEVVFSRLTGAANAAQTIDLTAGSSVKHIRVTAIGSISS